MILVNGCSNAEGFELEYEIGISIEDYLNDPEKQKEALEYRKTRTWSAILGQQLNLEVKNMASSGASNDRIILGTIDYIEKEDVCPELVVIAPTSLFRKQYMFNSEQSVVINPGHKSDYLNKLFNQTPHEKELDGWFEMTGMYFTDKEYQTYLYYHLIRYFIFYLEDKKINYLIAPGTHGVPSVRHLTDKSIDADFQTFYYSNAYPRGPGNHPLSAAHETWGLAVWDRYREVYG